MFISKGKVVPKGITINGIKLSVTIKIIELVNPKENKQIYRCNFFNDEVKIVLMVN